MYVLTILKETGIILSIATVQKMSSKLPKFSHFNPSLAFFKYTKYKFFFLIPFYYVL